MKFHWCTDAACRWVWMSLEETIPYHALWFKANFEPMQFLRLLLEEEA